MKPVVPKPGAETQINEMEVIWKSDGNEMEVRWK